MILCKIEDSLFTCAISDLEYTSKDRIKLYGTDSRLFLSIDFSRYSELRNTGGASREGVGTLRKAVAVALQALKTLVLSFPIGEDSGEHPTKIPEMNLGRHFEHGSL